jgi:predicted RNA polymerase sigma factor
MEKKPLLSEAEKLQLTNNPYYFSLLGELYTGIDNTKAKQHFEKAMTLAKTLADRHVIQKKLMNIG